MFNKDERFIRNVLKQLAKQRVAGIVNGAWVIGDGIILDKDIEAALRTCHLRGWVEPITKAIPQSNVSMDLEIKPGMSGPAYRLTEAGWNIIHGSYRTIKATFWITAFTLLLSVFGMFLSYYLQQQTRFSAENISTSSVIE